MIYCQSPHCHIALRSGLWWTGVYWDLLYTQGGEEKKSGKKGEKAAVDKAAGRREKEQQREAAAAVAAEQSRKQAELELLLMDESAPRQAYPSCRLPCFQDPALTRASRT